MGDMLFDVIPKSSEIWQGDADDGNIQLYTDEEKTGTFDIATIRVKLKEGATIGDAGVTNLKVNAGITVENIKFGNVEGVEKNVDSVSKDVIFSQNVQEGGQGENNQGTSTTTNTNNNVENPSTVDINIVILVSIMVLLVVAVVVSKKKLKKLK